MADPQRPSRLTFVDAARGLAVILMLQTHAYDAWLRPELRFTKFFGWSQLVGGLPAAFFLLLLGISAALASDASRLKGLEARDLMAQGLRRSAEIMFYAFAFRLAMYLASDRPDVEGIFRVDVLNCLALASAFLTGLDSVRERSVRIVTAIAVGLWFALAAAFVWDGGLADGLPVRIAGYLTGRVPNTFFPVFPWVAFAFLGHAAGDVIAGFRGGSFEGAARRLLLAGLVLPPLSNLLDTLPTIGPKYDYWYTSPNFILYKTGVLLILVALAFYADRFREALLEGRGFRWIRPEAASLNRVFSAVMEPVYAAFTQMGRTSLFIYCVHVDIVYGSRVVPKLWRSCEIGEATRNLLILTLVMLALSHAWVALKRRAGREWARFRTASQVAS